MKIIYLDIQVKEVQLLVILKVKHTEVIKNYSFKL